MLSFYLFHKTSISLAHSQITTWVLILQLIYYVSYNPLENPSKIKLITTIHKQAFDIHIKDIMVGNV